MQKLLLLEDELQPSGEFGQDEAVTAVADSNPKDPCGNLPIPNRPHRKLHLPRSPPGGKTELAKALAALLFDTEDANGARTTNVGNTMEKHAGLPVGFWAPPE